MFHSLKQDTIEFVSNPPLDPIKVRKLSIRDDGSPADTFELEKVDQRGFLAGVHYDRQSMSLMSRLRLGIPLQQVSIGVTENDPNVLYRSVNRFVNELDSRLSSRVSSAAVTAAEPAAVTAAEPAAAPAGSNN